MTRSSWVLGTAATLLAAALSGCGATGPAFSGIVPPAPQSREGVLYLLRESSIRGAAKSMDVRIGRRPVGQLVNGSYLRLVLNDQQDFVPLYVESCRPLRNGLLVRAGDTVYVQAVMRPGSMTMGGQYYFAPYCELEPLSAEQALPRLQSLRLPG